METTLVANSLKKKSGDEAPAVVIGGHDTNSYSNNSSYQRLAADAVKKRIEDEIMLKLDVESFSSTSNIIRLADFGCGVGSNTLNAMQGLIGVVKNKYMSDQYPTSQTMLEFQLIFNDQSTNDFNTLFASLPQEKEYFVAGVPGSFHHQLQDKHSPAWNKGRIHYTSAPKEVLDAYTSQFAEDLGNFLNARAQEIVSGGMMVIIGSSIPDGMPYSQVANGLMYNCMGSILMDMAKRGSIREDELDAFNLPIYACPPGEFIEGIERNGCFTVEVMELMNPAPWLKGPIDIPVFVNHVRAAMEGMFHTHFSSETIDELFKQLVVRLSEVSDQMESCYRDGLQLLAILKRK